MIMHNFDQLIEINYGELINKARDILASWKHRGISLCDKILVINSLVASLFTYRMTVLPTLPKSILKIYNEMINKFLWQGG